MSVKSILLIICGFLALSLGAIGIFFPIMPTTPFVLVSAACFGSSSPTLYNKLLNAKHFGQFVDNYKNKSGITKAVKTRSIIFLWITLIISAILVAKVTVVIILLCVGLAVSAHILMMKSR